MLFKWSELVLTENFHPLSSQGVWEPLPWAEWGQEVAGRSPLPLLPAPFHPQGHCSLPLGSPDGADGSTSAGSRDTVPALGDESARARH